MMPFRLHPVYKPYLWGGTRLIEQYGKQPDLPVLAESWELSAHRNGDCTVATGPFREMPLSRLVAEHPEILGSGSNDECPILIKLIDARLNLSVQVHPDDAYARRSGHDHGKTEMWVVLEAESDSALYCGFNRRISPAEFRQRIEDGSLADVLERKPVIKGDVVFIPAGTIHAIGEGILIAEIQQSSDLTYRVYDYGRLDATGRPRELHIQNALDVTRLEPANFTAPGARPLCRAKDFGVQRLAGCPYFTVDRITLSGLYRLGSPRLSFVSLLCADGDAVLRCEDERFKLGKGDSIFIPADSPACDLSGAGVFLKTFV